MRFRASLPCRRRAMPFFLGLYKVFAVHARYAHTSREETTRIQSPQIPYSENACFFRILRIDFRSKNPCPWSSVSPLNFVVLSAHTPGRAHIIMWKIFAAIFPPPASRNKHHRPNPTGK
jgi:hypothetical protein